MHKQALLFTLRRATITVYLQALISQDTIQQILSRIDIIDIVGGFVKLKKRGSNYLGLCPFHNEKTPSFTVSPTKEIYKCFGCGKSGNSISFLMEHEKYSYVEALKWLAQRYNVEVEESYATDEQKQQQQTAESLHILNQYAQKFFTESLFETEEGRDAGLEYLKERGFREETIREFQLGYAPEVRDSFTASALKKQFNAELLIKSGLSVERNGQLIDNYRGRIIFPVHNHSGKIIGFGARLIKKNDKAPKYINTPENELYLKSRILYGSYFARQAIDKADECLLVEGYTDVISLHQAGIKNVVASGGTSLTTEQLRLVRKYSSNLTIIYDGDAAGVKAALRGLDMALEESLNVKLVLIPDGDDPDSYLQKRGPTAFRKFIEENRKDFILFQLEVSLKDAGNDPARKSEVVNQMAETISRINKAEDFTRQQDYIRQCAQILNIDEEGMTVLVNKHIRNRIVAEEKKLPFEEAKHHAENAQKAEASGFSDETFGLLFKDELQEKEIARVLLEHGNKKWDDEKYISDFILSEIIDESLIENQDVLKLITTFRIVQQLKPEQANKNFFIYHTDQRLSTLAVSLLNFPYEESDHWKREFSQATGYQKDLFNQPYESFIQTLAEGNEENLMRFLKIDEDRTKEEVQSAVNYLKLRKIRRLLLENQADMQKPHSAEEFQTLQKTHDHLKKMEMDITGALGTVVFR